MNKYRVRITEILSNTIIVEAESMIDAENDVKKKYYDGKYGVDYDGVYFRSERIMENEL